MEKGVCKQDPPDHYVTPTAFFILSQEGGGIETWEGNQTLGPECESLMGVRRADPESEASQGRGRPEAEANTALLPPLHLSSSLTGDSLKNRDQGHSRSPAPQIPASDQDRKPHQEELQEPQNSELQCLPLFFCLFSSVLELGFHCPVLVFIL